MICQTCGNQNFWRSIFGGEFCWDCFPPIDFSLVQNPDSDFPRGGEVAIPDFPLPGRESQNPDFGNPIFRNPNSENPNLKNPEIEIRDLQFLPRGISWPTEVYALWSDLGELPPDWLDTRSDIMFRIDRRTVGRGRAATIEETRVPVIWTKPSWTHPSFPDPEMPQPNLVSRWRPNELPCCWWCGLALFWLDTSGDERCAMCSPVPWSDWSQVVRWIRKPGIESTKLPAAPLQQFPLLAGQCSLIETATLV